jgi:hypothetical protein
VRKELDSRVKKMESWLDEVKIAKDTQAADEPKATKPAKSEKKGKKAKK